MKKEEIEKEILSLPLGAWYEEEDLVNVETPFRHAYILLIRKRKWLESFLKDIN